MQNIFVQNIYFIRNLVSLFTPLLSLWGMILLKELNCLFFSGFLSVCLVLFCAFLKNTIVICIILIDVNYRIVCDYRYYGSQRFPGWGTDHEEATSPKAHSAVCSVYSGWTYLYHNRTHEKWKFTGVSTGYVTLSHRVWYLALVSVG